MGKIIGIDLGTTNSCVAVLEGGEARVIPNEVGARTTPSVVAFRPDGSALVGEAAKRQAITNPESTLYGIKRLIGRRFDSPAVTELKKTMPYEIVRAGNGDAWVRIGERNMSPPEISAYVLRAIKLSAEKYLGEPVEQAIVTVPAYFDDAQRQATKDAGHIAGLEVRSILNEPTAAALGYAVKTEEPATVAVFDLGGGTFDISILRIEDGVFEVLATNGDTFLGGDDFDRAMIESIADQVKAETGFEVRKDAAVLQRLKGAVEQAKHELSTLPKAELALPFIGVAPSGPIHLERALTREWLEALTKPIIERLSGPCFGAFEDARLTPFELDQVLLVGGMTRMPAVQAKVQSIFGKPASKGVNPDEIVALGAATQSGIMTGAVKDVALLDVASHSLGIREQGDRFIAVLKRNVTIPCRNTKVFTTTRDDQDFVVLEVFQGEDPCTDKNRPLGQFVLGDLPPGPAGTVAVEVSFALDPDGILSVDAREIRTGKATSKRILASSGLSRDEVARLRATQRLK